jgi:hypothetical protein
MPLSTRMLMASPIAWVKRQGGTGYLCLDDVVVEKAFAKKRKVYGLHIGVLLWCSADGYWHIPVAFRLWRPRRRCAQRDYRTKLQLAEQMVAVKERWQLEIVRDGEPPPTPLKACPHHLRATAYVLSVKE